MKGHMQLQSSTTASARETSPPSDPRLIAVVRCAPNVHELRVRAFSPENVEDLLREETVAIILERGDHPVTQQLLAALAEPAGAAREECAGEDARWHCFRRGADEAAFRWSSSIKPMNLRRRIASLQ